MSKFRYIDGHQIQLLHCGGEYFSELIAAIDQAVSQVYLETYIFSSDRTAASVRDALLRAAARGLQVKVVIDWLGSGREQAGQLQQQFLAGGVDCRCFNPWFARGLARTHRKMAVCDQRIALIGGLNIIDDCISDDGSEHPLPFPRWDFAVRMSGPLVAQMQLELESQWLRSGHLAISSRLALLRHLQQDARLGSRSRSRAALVVRDNFRNRSTIQKAYLHALGNARERAIIVTPYFAPGRKFRRALVSAANRGVHVTLLLGVGQFALQDAVTHSFYPKLLRHGIRIAEYRKTQLHAKVAVIDRDWATVGSSNVDGLSLFVNHEANVIIRDPVFSRKLALELERGLAEASPVSLADYVEIPWYRRAWYGTAYLVYRALMRVVTFGSYG